MKKIHTFTVDVEVPGKMSKKEAGRLLHRLIASGMEDACNTPGDYDDPDAKKAASLTIKVEGQKESI